MVPGDGRDSTSIDIKAAPSAALVEQALLVLAPRLPLSEREAHATLVRLGFSRRLTLAQLARLTARLGREPLFRLVDIGGTRVAVPRSHVTAAQAAYSVASRDVANWGMASIGGVTNQVRVRVPIRVDDAFVERVLSATAAFEMLDEARGWFWFVRRPNRMLHDLRKILSVVPRVSLRRLWQALARSWKGPESPPPGVLPRICAALPGVRVTGDTVEVTERRIRPIAALGGAERWLVNVFRRSGRPLSLAEIQELSPVAWVTWRSLRLALHTSPLVENLPGPLFTLIGQ